MNILDLISYINIQITKCHNHDINLDHFKPVLKDTKIKDLITDCLTQVAEKGIDEVYTKKNFKELYKKYCS